MQVQLSVRHITRKNPSPAPAKPKAPQAPLPSATDLLNARKAVTGHQQLATEHAALASDAHALDDERQHQHHTTMAATHTSAAAKYTSDLVKGHQRMHQHHTELANRLSVAGNARGAAQQMDLAARHAATATTFASSPTTAPAHAP
jgi:hypothetical protein